MEENIKKIEDMSLNAWPSHKMELYDGWILRFSYFYTHRTNSVEQFDPRPFHGEKKFPIVRMSIAVWEVRLFLRLAPSFPLILITRWKTAVMRSSILQRL